MVLFFLGSCQMLAHSADQCSNRAHAHTQFHFCVCELSSYPGAALKSHRLNSNSNAKQSMECQRSPVVRIHCFGNIRQPICHRCKKRMAEGTSSEPTGRTSRAFEQINRDSIVSFELCPEKGANYRPCSRSANIVPAKKKSAHTFRSQPIYLEKSTAQNRLTAFPSLNKCLYTITEL